MAMDSQVAESGGIGLAAAGGNGALASILTGGGKKGAGGGNSGRKGTGRAGKKSQGQAGAKGFVERARPGVELGSPAPQGAAGGVWPDQAQYSTAIHLLPDGRAPERFSGAKDAPSQGAMSLNSPMPAGGSAADGVHSLTPRDRIGQKLFATNALRDTLRPNEEDERIDISPDKEAAKSKAPERNRFQAKDKTLLSALSAHPSASPRTPEWAIKVIEGIYKTIGDKVPLPSSAEMHRLSLLRIPFSTFGIAYG